MRKIKFRGKNANATKEWVYGSLLGKGIIITDNGDQIIVDEETVAQYICDDCKGNEIYENSVVRWDSFYWGDSLEPAGAGVIKWEESYWYVQDSRGEFVDEIHSGNKWEVIGDIFEDQYKNDTGLNGIELVP